MSDNLAQLAYNHVYEKLTRDKLAAGSRLSNRAVAKELGISLTPVRGAFNRLISEGFLEYQPGVGVFIPTSHRREIEEFYEFREILECASVAKTNGHMRDRVLQQIEDCNEELAGILDWLEKIIEPLENQTQENQTQMEQFHLTDKKFHMALLRASGNRQIMETVEGLWVRTQIVCHRFLEKAYDNLRLAINEHRQILEALRRSKVNIAKDVLSQHIRWECQLALAREAQGYMERTRCSGGEIYGGILR